MWECETKKLLHSKRNNRMKRKPSELEKTLVSNTSNKEIISKIHEEINSITKKLSTYMYKLSTCIHTYIPIELSQN